jgi:protein-tyrosine phosphatase
LNWLAKGKILAFAGPSYERYVSPEGYCTLSPSDYIPYFKKRNVDLVVRLNKKNYNEEDFIKAGIRHVEHFFLDGSCPSMKILKEVLDSFESVPQGKAFAVHCKAGLGRTGSCIGAYVMKHYRFTAPEVIAWMRMCRPGCVIGPQQHFLQQIQDQMWQAGDAERMQVPRPLPQSSGNNSTNNNNAMVTTPKGKKAQVQDNDAITGRFGQGESLLAARGRRSTKSDSTKKEIPVPPMTPDGSKPPAAVLVTPGSVNSAKTKAAPLWSS